MQIPTNPDRLYFLIEKGKHGGLHASEVIELERLSAYWLDLYRRLGHKDAIKGLECQLRRLKRILRRKQSSDLRSQNREAVQRKRGARFAGTEPEIPPATW